MKHLKINNIIKNVIITFVVFMTGFIGTLISLMKRTSDITTMMIDSFVKTSETINFFGINIITFIGKYEENGVYTIDIIRHNLYNYIPIIAGALLLIIVFVLTILTKKITKSKSSL